MITTIKKKRRKISSLVEYHGETVSSNRLLNIPPDVRQTIAPQVKQKPECGNLVERINAAIAAGVSFDVGKDDFQITGAGCLTEPERKFYQVNKLPLLCTLQQSLLMKYLPTENIPDYIFEVKERAAILEFDGGTDTPFKIVRVVTAEWFNDVLEEITKR